METEKISLKKCKTILQKDGSVYTEEEEEVAQRFPLDVNRIVVQRFHENSNKGIRTKRN